MRLLCWCVLVLCMDLEFIYMIRRPEEEEEEAFCRIMTRTKTTMLL